MFCVIFIRTLLADANLAPGTKPTISTALASQAGAAAETQANPMNKQRNSRRMSMREVVLEEKRAQGSGNGGSGAKSARSADKNTDVSIFLTFL